jgi:hypothetical protein
MPPYSVEFSQEIVVALHVTQLSVRVAVFLQGPVRRRRDDQVNTLCLEKTEVPRIMAVQMMDRWNLAELRIDAGGESRIPGYPRQIRLVISDGAHFTWDERRQITIWQGRGLYGAHWR